MYIQVDNKLRMYQTEKYIRTKSLFINSKNNSLSIFIRDGSKFRNLH